MNDGQLRFERKQFRDGRTVDRATHDPIGTDAPRPVIA